MAELLILDAVMGTTAKVRILRVLMSRPSAAWSEAELAREIGMSPNTTNLAVRSLARTGVLAEGSGGRNAVRLNVNSSIVRGLSPAFSSEREVLRNLTKALSRIVPQDASCILFGSVARGDSGPDSDIDLLIVARTLDEAASIHGRVVEAAHEILPGRYRCLHYTPAMARARMGTELFANIRRDAIVLAGRPLEAFA